MANKEVMQIDDIIECPRKENSPNQPEYESDVYNIEKVEANNKKHMGIHGRRNRIVATNINFACRDNNRKE